MNNQMDLSAIYKNNIPIHYISSTSPALYKAFWHMVIFFEPAYLANGHNGCRIYYENGLVEESSARLEWVLDDWASCRATNKAMLQKQAAAFIGGGDRRRIPLIIDDELCLIPVKCRKPRERHEIVSGYAVLHKISVVGLTQENKTVLIFGDNSQSITVLERQRNVKKKMTLARQMLALYQSGFCCAVDYNILLAGNEEKPQ